MTASPEPVAPPRVQQARVNGVDPGYLDQGAGAPVVFVHGAPGDCRAWEGQREAVAQRYRFIAPTQRYFGTGPWPDDGARFSMGTHVDDLAALIAKLDAGPVHVVGWSYGGGIALALVTSHPEWVKSLFVFEPGLATFVTDPDDARVAGEDRKNMQAPALEAAKVGDIVGAVRLLVDGVSGQPGTFDRLASPMRSVLLENARTLPLSLSAPPPPPITCSQLGQIEVPVTIARGELTRSFYRIAAATAHRCIPESQLVILPGGRHWAPTEHPSAFNEVLLDSLEEQRRR